MRDKQDNTYTAFLFQGLFIEPFSIPTMGGSAPELHQIQRLSKLGAGPEDDRERLGPRYVLPQREAGDLPHSYCKQQTASHLPERDCVLQYQVRVTSPGLD